MSRPAEGSALPESAAALDPAAGRLLEGCNAYDRSSVFVLPAKLPSAAVKIESGRAAAFYDRFNALDPQLTRVESHLRFLARLDRGDATFAEALLQAIFAVERSLTLYLGRLPLSDFSALVEDSGRPGTVTLVWSAWNPRLARTAAELGRAGLLELLGADTPAGGFDEALTAVRERLKKRRRTEGAALIAAAVARLGLPHELLGTSYIRLGEGARQQTVATPAIAARIGDDVDRETRIEQAQRELRRVCRHPSPARIPTVVVAGDRRASSVAREVERLLRAAGRSVGLSSADRATIDGKPVETELSRSEALRFLQRDPRVEVLVHAAPPGRALRRGLRLDRCRVTVVLGPSRDRDPEVYRQGVEIAVRAANGPVLLDLRHPLTEMLLGELEAPRVILTGARRARPEIAQHARAGGLGLLSASGTPERLELFEGEQVRSIDLPPGVAGDRTRRAALIKAVGVALGLGVPQQEIATAIVRRACLRD